MKIKDGFMLRNIVDSWVVVPIGQRVVEFNGLMTLSESAALLWEKLQKDNNMDELVASILAEYNVDETTARKDIYEFIDEIGRRGFLDNEYNISKN